MLAKAERIDHKSAMSKRRFDDQFRFNLRRRDKEVFERIAKLLDLDLSDWVRDRLKKAANADLVALGKAPHSFVDEIDEGANDANAKPTEPAAPGPTVTGKRARS